jgi:hypothetical protein
MDTPRRARKRAVGTHERHLLYLSESQEDQDHDSMVKEVADHLSEIGYSNILAHRVSGYQNPEVICWEGEDHGKIPDVIAISPDSIEFVIEIETPQGLNKKNSLEQLELFNNYASGPMKSCQLVVPDEIEDDAEYLLSFNDLEHVEVVCISRFRE